VNERIKELMFDAGLNSNYVEGFDSIYSKQLEKFAELIVRECANVADENYIHRGSRTCGLAIRLHFGVEE